MLDTARLEWKRELLKVLRSANKEILHKAEQPPRYYMIILKEEKQTTRQDISGIPTTTYLWRAKISIGKEQPTPRLQRLLASFPGTVAA